MNIHNTTKIVAPMTAQTGLNNRTNKGCIKEQLRKLRGTAE